MIHVSVCSGILALTCLTSGLVLAPRPSLAMRILSGIGIPVKPIVHDFVDNVPYVPFVTAVPLEIEESNLDDDEKDYHRSARRGKPGAYRMY